METATVVLLCIGILAWNAARELEDRWWKDRPRTKKPAAGDEPETEE